MTLKEFENYIDSFPENHPFDYGISECFQYKGDASKVAFSINGNFTRKESILKNITSAYSFCYIDKEGKPKKYHENTIIAFEDKPNEWTNKIYTADTIGGVLHTTQWKNLEEVLVKTVFNKDDNTLNKIKRKEIQL